MRNVWRRLIKPLGTLLSGGMAPAVLIRALTVGMLLGSMPLVWGTSLLCLGAALLLRLNPLAVQVGNFAAWPLQILLAYPYLQLGSAWFGSARLPADAAFAGWLHALIAANGAALGAWAISVPLLLPVYFTVSHFLVATVGRLCHGPCAEGEGGTEGTGTIQA